MMLALPNIVLREAPTSHHNHFSPIETILDWPMGMSAGFALFTNDKVNAQFKKVIDAWHGFLATSESLYNQRGRGRLVFSQSAESDAQLYRDVRLRPKRNHILGTSPGTSYSRARSALGCAQSLLPTTRGSRTRASQRCTLSRGTSTSAMRSG